MSKRPHQDLYFKLEKLKGENSNDEKDFAGNNNHGAWAHGHTNSAGHGRRG
jgi:hypothetical protein